MAARNLQYLGRYPACGMCGMCSQHAYIHRKTVNTKQRPVKICVWLPAQPGRTICTLAGLNSQHYRSIIDFGEIYRACPRRSGTVHYLDAMYPAFLQSSASRNRSSCDL